MTEELVPYGTKIKGAAPPQDYYLRNVPGAEWRSWKAWAATHGTTVRDLILTAVREYVTKHR